MYSLLAAQASNAAHLVVAKDDKKLQGTVILSNTNQDTVKQNKDQISQSLTKKVQADGKNTDATVSLTDVRTLPSGELAFDYECTGTHDQNTAKDSLKKAVNDDDVKKTINNPTKTVTTTTKSQPKTTTTTVQSKFKLILSIKNI